MVAVWPPGPADLWSCQKALLPLTNPYNFSAFCLISFPTSQCSVWKYLLTYCFRERICIRVRCKSHSAILRASKSLQLSALSHVTVSCHLFLKIFQQYLWTACSFLAFSFLPVSFLPSACPLWLYGALPCSGEELVIAWPSSFWNISPINTDPDFRLVSELPYLSFRKSVASSISADCRSKSMKLKWLCHVCLVRSVYSKGGLKIHPSSALRDWWIRTSDCGQSYGLGTPPLNSSWYLYFKVILPQIVL